MRHDDMTGPWTSANFAMMEASLWQTNPLAPLDLVWLELSWQDPINFYRGLHAYSNRRLGSPSKSIPWVRYDFYHDVLIRHKDLTKPALIWFEKGQWLQWSYAELAQAVNGLAATWEAKVQPGESLVILHPQGPHWLTALLAGLRLGLVITLLPPQGNAFVQRRLEQIAPKWLAIDSLYRHQLATSWQDFVLPNSLSNLAPSRRSYEYSGTDLVAQCLDPTSPTPDIPVPVTADSLYLGAMRDGIFALTTKPGQICAAPGWHGVESQPALMLAVFMSGATWLHISMADLEQAPERILTQAIDVLGISLPLLELLKKNPPINKPNWRYWFRHPAESTDYMAWQDFIQAWQLQDVYAGNLICNSAQGGAILFSGRCLWQTQLQVLPAAGSTWQLGIIESPELPSVSGWGRLALGKVEEEKTVWTATPYILAANANTSHYLGHYPRGRAGRTYPVQEVLDLLKNKIPYLALVETSEHGGNTDLRQLLLVFGKDIAIDALRKHIETELGTEFLPDHIEQLPLLPLCNKAGGADQDWCQQHYVSGELYRRQRSQVFCCLSELKGMVLGGGGLCKA